MDKITLKMARVRAGLGRDEAAKKLGVVPDSIWRWEIGRQSPPARTAERICALYGVAFEDIDWDVKERR